MGEKEVRWSVGTGGTMDTPVPLSHTHTSTQVYCVHLQITVVCIN